MYRASLWLTGLTLLTTAQAGGGGAASAVCDSSPTMNLVDVQKSLTAAEALWQRRGSEAYGLTTDAQGQLSFSMAVQVGGPLVTGQITPEQVRLPGQAAPPSVPRQATTAVTERYTVPGLFAQVQRLLNSHRPANGGRTLTHGMLIPPLPGVAGVPPCGILNVTFDSHDGHLRRLVYDFSGSIDDEFTLTISPLLPLP